MYYDTIEKQWHSSRTGGAMRHLVILMVTTVFCFADHYDTAPQNAREAANTWHATRATLPISRGQTVGLRNAPDALLADLGIIAGVVDAVPDGMVHTGAWTVEIIDGVAHRVPTCRTQTEQDAIDAAEAAAEAERLNAPIVYDQPIETPALVLQSHTGGIGVGVVASDEGELIPFTYHASPVPSPEEIKSRKDAALQRRRNAVEVVKAKGRQFKSQNASANSVPKMRDALVMLQEQMAAIQELLGIEQ